MPDQYPPAPQSADGPADFDNYEAKFSIVQQPIRARSCGNADRDRRCLDPPPVLKLEIVNKQTGRLDLDYMKQYSWVVLCFLYTPSQAPWESIYLGRSFHGGRVLIRGNMVGNAQYSDLAIPGYKGEACYFCFPDLSLSTAGQYRLKFQWAWIDQTNPIRGQIRTMGTMGYLMSDIFRVYAAKDFPSMLPMTPISIALKKKGLWIRGGIQRNRRRLSSKNPPVPGADDADDKDSDPEDDVETDPDRLVLAALRAPAAAGPSRASTRGSPAPAHRAGPSLGPGSALLAAPTPMLPGHIPSMVAGSTAPLGHMPGHVAPHASRSQHIPHASLAQLGHPSHIAGHPSTLPPVQSPAHGLHTPYAVAPVRALSHQSTSPVTSHHRHSNVDSHARASASPTAAPTLRHAHSPKHSSAHAAAARPPHSSRSSPHPPPAHHRHSSRSSPAPDPYARLPVRITNLVHNDHDRTAGGRTPTR
ncbi:velvet factor-domain-containing protein [Dipodascopsis tothii]|uniref:velvet factor-domain-containing protein n=1 Tax=Dipodascopsis tothii TaxID=44089 RepID=UPI0034CEAA12